MPLNPVSGEIKSQAINDNFSALESQIKNISKGSPSGTFATLAELEAKYPNGNNNMYVVTADGKWYYWSGTDWVAGGVYQSQGIADGSITTDKVESAIATPLICYTNKVNPNYDTATQTLTIPKNVDGSSIIYFSGTKWKGIPMTEDIVIDASAVDLTTRILVFDFDTLTFNWQRWYDKLSKTQIPTGSMRGNGQAIHSPYFDITVDRKPTTVIPDRTIKSIQAEAYVATTFVAYPNTEWPSYDPTTKTLKIPKTSDGSSTVIYSGNEYVSLPNEDIFVPLGDTPAGTSKLVFDFDTALFSWETWYKKLTKSQVMIAYMRGNGKVIYSPYFEITVDGAKKDEPTIIPVPVGAAITNIWHRGYSSVYPENTLIAYRAAKKFGCNEVEMDLDYTSDDIPVNLHDGTINRTGRNLDGTIIADETTSIASLTYEQTKSYEFGSWKSSKFLGEKLPTFEECLMLCKRLNMTLHVDRAWYIDRDTRFVQTKEIVERVGYDRIVWYINTQSQAQTIRNMFPKGDIYFLLAQGTDITQESIDTCVQYGLSKKIGEGRCEILSTGNLATLPAIQNALDAGVKVNLWGADNIDRDQYAEWGVTGFSTDGINIIQELLEDI